MHELREREDGQTTTEYAILLGFLAIAIIIALFFLRNVLRELFSTRQQRLERAELDRRLPPDSDGPHERAGRTLAGLGRICLRTTFGPHHRLSARCAGPEHRRRSSRRSQTRSGPAPLQSGGGTSS